MIVPVAIAMLRLKWYTFVRFNYITINSYPNKMHHFSWNGEVSQFIATIDRRIHFNSQCKVGSSWQCNIGFRWTMTQSETINKVWILRLICSKHTHLLVRLIGVASKLHTWISSERNASYLTQIEQTFDSNLQIVFDFSPNNNRAHVLFISLSTILIVHWFIMLFRCVCAIWSNFFLSANFVLVHLFVVFVVFIEYSENVMRNLRGSGFERDWCMDFQPLGYWRCIQPPEVYDMLL